MERFDKRRDELEKRGATLAGVSVDSVETSLALVKKLDLHFPILADTRGEMIRAYGVWHASAGIALPAIFVVAPDGKILWRRVSETVTDRPPEDEVLAVLGR